MIRALILINTDSGRENEVCERLMELGIAREIHIVYGVYDVVALLDVSSYEELKRAVSEIRKIPFVRSTTTLIVVK